MNMTEFIVLIRQLFGRYPDMSYGCLKFHLLLREVFPEAGDLYYNSNHVLTPIGGKFYDIDGEQELTPDFLPFSDFGPKPFSGFNLGEPYQSLFRKHYEHN